MNLARVLDQALPAVSPERATDYLPRIHPRLIVREYEDRDGPIFMCIIPGGKPPHYFRLNRYQYTLCTCFDGQRDYQQVRDEFAFQTGVQLTVENVKEFADALEKSEFWYRTPQEASAMLCHELVDQRKRSLKKKRDLGDLATITLIHFDPDRFLQWVYKYFFWLYSRWFTAWSFFMLLVASLILGSRWHEVWTDSIAFYNLMGHGAWHAVMFFVMFLTLGAFHETAHGLTCTHFGGHAHRMGVFTIYLVPAIFCDVSEVWVYGGRWERIATVAAGVWSEVVICCYATVVWWATPPGTFLHTASYYVILSGGIFCALVNWNPLSRMDGYYLFCELLRFHDIKSQANFFLSSWVRRHIFRMPATVPPLPLLRQIGFATYALLSGWYCYFLLLFLCRLTYHILVYYSPQWAFLPAGFVAYLAFRSRLKKLGQFMREFYLDKHPLMQRHRGILLAAAAAIVIVLLVPLRRERVEERFTLEPLNRAVLRAQVPGMVNGIFVREGDRVAAGQTIARLEDVGLQSRVAEAAAAVNTADARARGAMLRYADLAAAQQEQARYRTAAALALDRQQRLELHSDIAGVVVTPRVQDLQGTYVKEGTEIAEVADTSIMRARIYVAQHEMRKLRNISAVSLLPDSSWTTRAASVAMISSASEEPPKAPGAVEGYAGVKGESYFDVQVLVNNSDGKLRDGATGIAKILGRRRGLLVTWLEPVWDAAARRIW